MSYNLCCRNACCCLLLGLRFGFGSCCCMLVDSLLGKEGGGVGGGGREDLGDAPVLPTAPAPALLPLVVGDRLEATAESLLYVL